MTLRFDTGFGLEAPDRSEYFWARMGQKGPPAPETNVNYSDLRFLLEAGGQAFSVTTDLGMRSINPDINSATTGIGDMTVTTKLALFTGARWQFTQLTRTYINLGPPIRGLGTSHFSLEPGLLARYKISSRSYLHSELKLWIPLGGTPNFSGEVLNYGFGLSTVLADSPREALLGTLELEGITFLNGQKTIGLIPVPVNSDRVLMFGPGLRYVIDTNRDLNLLELGMQAGFELTAEQYFDALLRFELRCAY